jgi:serine/threonine protein kinase
MKRIYKEIEALKSFDHPNVCRLLQVIETSTRIYLVLEYCAGSELFDYIGMLSLKRKWINSY